MGNTHEEVRINGFGGDDLVIGNLADNLVWGGTGRSDTRRSQQSLTQFRRGGSDMLYGGPGTISSMAKRWQRLFGGIGNDKSGEMKAMTCCGVVSVKTSLR